MSWKHIASSVTGKSHIDRQENGQDCFRTGVVHWRTKNILSGLRLTALAVQFPGVPVHASHANPHI